jgi:hypothetical protein
LVRAGIYEASVRISARYSYSVSQKGMMKILVIGAGMMGWAAAFDMVRSPRVETVKLADEVLTAAGGEPI